MERKAQCPTLARNAQQQPAMETINASWQAASEEMYKASQEAGANPNEGQEASENSGDDVTDVEFEEVKDDEK